jgi:hypothetical protein
MKEIKKEIQKKRRMHLVKQQIGYEISGKPYGINENGL